MLYGRIRSLTQVIFSFVSLIPPINGVNKSRVLSLDLWLQSLINNKLKFSSYLTTANAQTWFNYDLGLVPSLLKWVYDDSAFQSHSTFCWCHPDAHLCINLFVKIRENNQMKLNLLVLNILLFNICHSMDDNTLKMKRLMRKVEHQLSENKKKSHSRGLR